MHEMLSTPVKPGQRTPRSLSTAADDIWPLLPTFSAPGALPVRLCVCVYVYTEGEGEKEAERERFIDVNVTALNALLVLLD